MAARRAPLIVDLGCGTGALSRVLAPLAPADARWRLVDKEPELLEEAAASHARLGLAAPECAALDLASVVDLSAALRDADVVAATAFYDLVSAAWVERFAALTPPTAIVYAALTYDGEERWAPPHETDESVLNAFHAHQRRDMGLGGKALGPSAAAVLAKTLREQGWSVDAARTPWVLDQPRDAALRGELADGVAKAATALGADGAAWRAAPRDSAWIGHVDILAEPADA